MTPIELHNKEVESQRTETEIYSRIVGYIRPIDSANDGKRAEIDDRVMYKMS